MKIALKKLLATALIVTAALTMFSVSMFQLRADEIESDYARVAGVLHSDSYLLYPYANHSLDIGFTKYGEMISYDSVADLGLGLQYPGYAEIGSYDQDVPEEDEESVDPFCNEQIPVESWINGWFMDIKYLRVGAAESTWREIWALALFSDGVGIQGNWTTMPEVDEDDDARPLWQEYPPYANPDSDLYDAPKPPYGGRKTNGVCVTDPITVVYNGPRKFVAMLKTRVSDGPVPLVDVIFTIIFNKVEKNVIILKDIKRLYGKRPLNIAFGNRGEWDLSPPSWVHFYTDEPVQSWDSNQDGAIDPFDEDHEFFYEYFRQNKHPKKWWQDVPYHDYPEYIHGERFEDTREYIEWFETQYTCYGREWHMDKTIKDHSYAVCQVVDDDAEWVGAMAVWPHPEFWSADYLFKNARTPTEGVPLMFKPLTRCLEWNRWTVVNDPEQGGFENPEGILDDRENVWVKMDDMYSEKQPFPEAGIPWLVYEHDFELALGMDEYRTVTVYTVTDYHDADDFDAPDLDEDGVNENKIDREIQYQLDEIFDPWDLTDAMHKYTKRWVEFFEHAWYWDGDEWVEEDWDGETYNCVKLPETREDETGKEIPTLPVWYEGGAWDSYCSFAERVLVDTGDGYELIAPGYISYMGYRMPVDYHLYDPVPWDEEEERRYYEIDPYTGEICFWEYDEDLEDWFEWYLPEDSVVKVLWSTMHVETEAEEWYRSYPVMADGYTSYINDDGDWKNFPLHQSWPHMVKYWGPYSPEVFIVEQPAQALRRGGYTVHSWTESGYYYYSIKFPVLLSTVTALEVYHEWNDDVGAYYMRKNEMSGAQQIFTRGDEDYYTARRQVYWDVSSRADWNYEAYYNAINFSAPPMQGQRILVTWDHDIADRGGKEHYMGDGQMTMFGLPEVPDDPATIQVYNFTDELEYGDYVINYNTGEIKIGEPPHEYKEISVKYYHLPGGDTWHHEKFLGDGKTEIFNLTYAPIAENSENVWLHSEKALHDGDFVTCNDGDVIYLQDPLPEGEWLLATYEYGGTYYEDWFLAQGPHAWDRNEFELRYPPDVGTLHIYRTEVWEEILPPGTYGSWPYGDWDTWTNIWSPTPGAYLKDMPGNARCPVPDWEYANLPAYKPDVWLKLETEKWSSSLGKYKNTTEECEWITTTYELERGKYIIRETETCDELVLNQALEYGETLKIVYGFPSGRYEWAIVGNHTRAIDSAGLAMVTAAIKNKNIEIGLAGLDVEDPMFGPIVPYIAADMGHLGTGRHPAIDYYDSIGRVHLCDDWCYSRTGVGTDTSWPIASSNIITVGGPPSNIVSEYWNDFINAFMTLQPTYPGTIDAIFPLTCWNDTYPDTRYLWEPVDARYGHAVISTSKDKNGTVGLVIWGWTGQDTYYACKWFEQNKYWLQHINPHVTDLVLEIEYEDEDGEPLCPPEVEIVEYLGTISEKPQHDC